MKAILINGSPRKKGHTAALLDKVREGLDAGGSETLYFKGLTMFDPPERYVVGQNLVDTFTAMERDHYAEYERTAFALGKRLADRATAQQAQNVKAY